MFAHQNQKWKEQSYVKHQWEKSGINLTLDQNWEKKKYCNWVRERNGTAILHLSLTSLKAVFNGGNFNNKNCSH